jgi:hypothetical protein
MIFDSDVSKPGIDGSLWEKFFKRYNDIKSDFRKNIGWEVIKTFFPSEKISISKSNPDQFERLRFLNHAPPSTYGISSSKGSL